MIRGTGSLRRLTAHLWHFKLTRGGRFLVASGLASGMLGASSGIAPTYAVLCTLFFVGLLALIANALARPRLQLSLRLPDRAMAGEDVRGVATVHNAGRRAAWDVSAGFPRTPRSLRNISGDPCVASLPPGGEADIPIAIKPLKRGFYSLPPLRGFTTYPFNVLRAGRAAVPSGTLMVVPRFTPLDSIALRAGKRYQPGGFSLTSSIGESPEYIGNRDYVPGDSMRRIDSRAWARLGKPAVREYQEEYYCRIALVLDTFIPPRRRAKPEGFEELEAAISLSAAIADALARGEYIIDVFAAGPELYTFRAGLNIAHLDNVLEILSCVEACRTNPFETLAPALAEEIGSISTIVCVFLDWDTPRRNLVRMAGDVGCAARVVVVRGGATTEAIAPDEQDIITVIDPAQVLAGGVTEL